ncbi:hypothetical protein VB712_15575 [Spirulina sp. CCNP1310]|uniref:hypothetical protein n=1 Tax=Spirulina sp. CCNP1310 TaxID=3110249 RepID=UPI002B20A128|nr:hypothetical protein [Spirulina sp. CCNP1310]MEA5420653.1 hypothetical protein [Spirulina sp. CCNP1310]
MQGFLKRTLALSTILVFPLISLDATARTPSRYRREYQSLEFQQCAADLIRVGLGVEQTKAACAMALEPTDLSNCVVGIDTLTPVSAQNALYSCFRVRRPVELAQCVVDIHRDVLVPKLTEGTTLDEVALSTLDHCRRSLLPLRYSACVVGLSGQLTLEPQNAIATCINAEDFPREIYTPAPNSTLGTDL